jgi:hypothetical protein
VSSESPEACSRVHRLRAGHRGQPGENRGHHQHRAYQRFERSTKGHGCLAALSRVISRLDEKSLPLYRLLRKTERFTWTPEAEEALGNLKALLTNAPILVPPRYRRSPLDLRSRNHLGGQHRDRSRETRRRAYTARPEAGLLHQ